MNKTSGKETSTVNITYKPSAKEPAVPNNTNKTAGKEFTGVSTKRPNQKQRNRQKVTKIISPKKVYAECSTQTEEECSTDVNQLTKAAHIIYSFCHTNAGELLPIEKVLDESSKILQALAQLSKSFDFSDIPESIPFTKKLREEVKSIEKCHNRCRELVSSEELQSFLPKTKLKGLGTLVHCKMLLEEFKLRERKFRQAVISIIESENLGLKRAENILSKMDHKEQIHDLVDSVAENQRISSNKDKDELHDQYREISIKQKNQIQKLEMKLEKYEEDKEKIRDECRRQVIEIEKGLILCNQQWERKLQEQSNKLELYDSEKTKLLRLLEEEKQKIAHRDIETRKLNKLYHETKDKLKETEKLNYNMSKARRKSHKNLVDKACSANLKAEYTSTHCQTENSISVPKSNTSGFSSNTALSSADQQKMSSHNKHQNHFHGPINNVHLYQIFPERSSNSSIPHKESVQSGKSRSSSRLHISTGTRRQSLTNQNQEQSVTFEHHEETEFVYRSESTMSFANSDSLHGDDY
ncbi:uveal autoantigen with coiled-coil domains and ankyrin repeats-like [Saccostrea cucullata]|uniref:uveal autoantigen with coiled-coil domains and ankyrin repeats-like n=1 Tax=Saccostrea cuccullata TaxID=36930 RepID=UPI002ED4BBF1